MLLGPREPQVEPGGGGLQEASYTLEAFLPLQQAL